MNNIVFTVPEVVALIGVFQCVYILVYVGFRVGDFWRIMLPIMYFFVLGLAFFTDLARNYISEISEYYEIISWLSWTSVIPISVLLIIQMSRIKTLPPLFNWSILLVVPLAFFSAAFSARYAVPDCLNKLNCIAFYEFLDVTGLMAGAISLLAIWANRNLFDSVLRQKAGKERYWLILSLIIINIVFLLLTAFKTTSQHLTTEIALLRNVIGLAFVYLVSTSLFRIYPQALFLRDRPQNQDELTDEEMEIAEKIDALLSLEKIYHEPTYSRSDLARELNVAEAMLSRIINIHFQKSFPQLLNEKRVEDAKRLLLETDASIKIISEEVGFNSLPSFNRVFKEMSGQSPSSFRKFTVK